jgi:hypothetical protein
MLVLAVAFLFPLVYMLASSFKPDDQVLGESQSFEAFPPTPFVGMENHQDAIDRAQFPRAFLNSVIISGFIVGLGLLVNSILGYALARLQFRGKQIVVGVGIARLPPDGEHCRGPAWRPGLVPTTCRGRAFGSGVAGSRGCGRVSPDRWNGSVGVGRGVGGSFTER